MISYYGQIVDTYVLQYDFIKIVSFCTYLVYKNLKSIRWKNYKVHKTVETLMLLKKKNLKI